MSAFVLWSYFQHVGRRVGWADPHNLYFYFVIIMQVVSLVISFSVTGFNRKWKALIEARNRKKVDSGDDHVWGKSTDARSGTFLEPPAANPAASLPDLGTRLHPKGDKTVESTARLTSILGFTLLAGCLILALKSRLTRKSEDDLVD